MLSILPFFTVSGRNNIKKREKKRKKKKRGKFCG